MKKLHELISIIDNEISDFKKFINFLNNQESHCYTRKMETLEDIFKNINYHEGLSEKLTGLEIMKDFYIELEDRLQKLNISDIDEKIFLTDNIYLGFWAKDLSFDMFFYIDDDTFLYENFMSSHSELNKWVTDIIMNLFEEYNSCVDMNDVLSYIGEPVVSRRSLHLSPIYYEKEGGIKVNNDFNKSNKAIRCVGALVSWTKDDCDKHKYVVEQLDFKLKKMTEQINNK